MKYNYLRLMQEESRDLADFLASLSETDWNHPTLCTGWRVREVVSHMAAGHTIANGSYLLVLAKAGFVVDRASDLLARRFAAEHTPEQILATFRRGTAGKPKGPTALVPRGELFTDHLIHHQDIRRPLGRPREIPEERRAAALASLRHLSARVGSKARMRGLRVVADDAAFALGAGAELRGPAEALVLALCGRAAAVKDLHGEGAGLLGDRLAAEAAAAGDGTYRSVVGATARSGLRRSGEAR
jgi:uncharacterized protein (TIGR03083 family)